MFKCINRKAYIFLVLPLVFLAGGFCLAVDSEETVNPQYYIYLDKATIAKGYTVSAFEDSLKLSLVPGILDQDTGVDVMQLNENIPAPWQFKQISNIYQFEFRNKAAYDNHKPFYIQFSYTEDSDDLKQVFFYDKNFGKWRPLPTVDYPEENFVRSLIHLPFARIAVFSNPEILSVGQASWYRYKGGNFTASPDYPKGSILRVTNLDDENKPFIDVEVNDYGPNRGLHPKRVVDLDAVAFNRIASTRDGVINVKVEPIYIASDEERVLGVKISNISLEPVVDARGAIVIDRKTGESIYAKNATTTSPLASLTKMMAVHTFLNYKQDLDETVTYKLQDEEYNYEYCNKWESARVKLNEGDQVTVKDLIYSALVASANNAVESLVRVSGVSRDEFIKKMNQNALDFGASSTRFVEPTGLSPENVSSPRDYAIMINEILKSDLVRGVSIAPSYEFTTLNTEEKHKIYNTNSLIRYGGARVPITGSKTGYLHEAGYCLMISTNDYISVIFGADSRNEAAAEAQDLIKFSEKQ